MDLLNDKWLPALRRYEFERISLADAMERPLIEIQSGRPDFDFALILFAIGVTQTGYIPDAVFGPGPRFLQSEDAHNKGRLIPVGQLLLDEPGEKTILKNRDLFVRGNQRNALCRNCAALAFYTHTLFAGPAGPGLYPSKLFHTALYLVKRETFGETVNANLTSKKTPAAAYFSPANKYWLDDPDGEQECALCGTVGPVVTGFYSTKSGARPDPVINPHAARTASGKRYFIRPGEGLLEIADGAAFDSQRSTPPPAIAERAKLGDTIIGFGTCYNQSILKHLFHREFTLRPGTNWWPIRQCARAIFYTKNNRPIKLSDYDSNFVGEVTRAITDRIELGHDPVAAALAVYDHYCPQPKHDLHQYRLWKKLREQISQSPPQFGESNDQSTD